MDTYLLLKALHLISMVAWFAGLFYLPRLFVYHTENPANAAMLIVMQRKLALYIMLPAAVATSVFGFMLLMRNPGLMAMGWLHAKLLLVAALIGYHALLEAHRRHLAQGTSTRSSRYFRILNEAPTLLLITIVILAVVKPF